MSRQSRVLSVIAFLAVALTAAPGYAEAENEAGMTYYKDVLPIVPPHMIVA